MKELASIRELYGPAVQVALNSTIGNVISERAMERIRETILEEIGQNIEFFGSLPGAEMVMVADYTISTWFKPWHYYGNLAQGGHR